MANAAQRFDTSGLRLLIRCKQDDLFPVWMAVLFPCIQTNLVHSHHITCHVPALQIIRSATIHVGDLYSATWKSEPDWQNFDCYSISQLFSNSVINKSAFLENIIND